ncbi:MinD/ParA family protein [Desulfoscipio gibsoniae]|uniref:ATPase involved in chromosome partitioning n=1 Tax=Desulfoscipio gibsoniae DSM 7213 TaxID=767817 RepID=R4KM87_9FIRM|nr:MinD/ParA family protein [Desulfoscipio gibsoniae]AGL01640.1 ATPase involved in chromosome partitioning [Desulfoscipio gibsoniae DSM 7213]
MRIIKRIFTKEDTKEVSSAQRAVPVWGPRIITITSGKGGVGKTNLAVNLAIALLQLEQRVIIFDADLGMANVDVLLGVTPQLTLYDHLYKNVPIENILLPGPGGLKIIAGGSGFMELANLSNTQRFWLMENIDKLNKLADFILIDTGAGISKDVLAFCAAANEVVIVITPEPTSLTDAYGLIKVLDKFKLHREIHLIVNQARSHNESAGAVNRLKDVAAKYLFIKINFLGDIVYDQSVCRAVKSLQPFLLHNPNAKASAAVKKIAYTMLYKKEPEVIEDRGMRSFINKMTRLFR